MSTRRRSARRDATADPEAQQLRDMAARARHGDAPAIEACAEAVGAWWADAGRGWGRYAQPGAALAAALGEAAEAWRAQRPGDCALAAGSHRAGALATMGEAWVAGALQEAAARARQGDAPAIWACAEAVGAWWSNAGCGEGPYARPGPALAAALGAALDAWRAQNPVACAVTAIGYRRAGALATMGEAWVASALQAAVARAQQGDAPAIGACAEAVRAWWWDAGRGRGPYAQPGPALGEALGAAAEAWRAQRPGDCARAASEYRAGALAALGEAWVADALQEAAAQARQGNAPAIEACAEAVEAWWRDAERGAGAYAQPGPALGAALGEALVPVVAGTAPFAPLPFAGLQRAVARDAAAAALREAFGASQPDVARWEAWCRTGGGRIGWALLARATADDDCPAALAALAGRLQQCAALLRGQPLARWIADDDALARALRRLYGDAAWASALLEQAITARDADAMDAAQRLAGRAPAASEAS